MTETKTKQRIVIVEDHPMVSEHLAQIVNKQLDLEVCGEADNIQQAMGIIRDASPDLVIVDITLNGASGLELIKGLKSAGIQTPVLVLSMHDESLYAERALRSGAKGYITKHRSSQEVLAAIRKVMSGEIYLSEKMVANVLHRFNPAMGKTIKPRSVERLSDRELAVLEMIGNGQTSRAIAETLQLSIATVDTYRARIKEKLNIQNAFELQHFAIQWLRER